MSRIGAILLFQKRIFLPAVVLSVIASTLVPEPLSIAGIMYAAFSALMHYFMYDTMNPGDYHIYNNMGFSRGALWASTAVVGLTVILITKTIQWIFM